MVDAQQAGEQVWQFLSEELSLDAFEDWSAFYLTDAFRSGDVEAQASGRLIRAILNAYQDDSTEDGLRAELAAAFAKPSGGENRVGIPAMAAESNASPDINRVLVAA